MSNVKENRSGGGISFVSILQAWDLPEETIRQGLADVIHQIVQECDKPKHSVVPRSLGDAQSSAQENDQKDLHKSPEGVVS